MNTRRHIIFDLDGTLIDSKPEILKTYKLVFNEIPPKVMPDVGALNYGLNINDLLHGVYGAGAKEIAPAKALFASIYDISDYKETLLYKDVKEVLMALKRDGFELYIATNKRYVPTMRILEIKGLAGLFSNIIANEKIPGMMYTKRQMIAELKLAGSFCDGYMVGDSVSDIVAGKEEKLRTIAVNYGYETEEVLVALNPEYSASGFQNLYTFVINDSK